MFNTPGDNGLKYSYATSKMLAILWNTSVLGFILLGLLIILLLIKKYVNKKDNHNKQSISQNNINKSLLNTEPKIEFGALQLTTSILFYSLLVLTSFMISIVHGFEYLGKTVGVKLVTFLAVGSYGVIFHIIWRYFQYEDPKEFYQTIKTLKGKKLIGSFIGLIMWLWVVGMMFFMMNGVCHCIYNDNYGAVSTKYLLSTSLTRRIHLPRKICQNQQICRLYATLPQSTNTSVFINVHTGVNVKDLKVTMNFLNTTVIHTDLYSFKPQFDEQFGERIVWSFLFANLDPNTIYDVILKTEYNATVKTTYKTLPSFGDPTAINVIVGGDVGLEEFGRQIFEQIAQKQNPDLILIGGDIAYDNAMTYCYYNWDNFYSMIEYITNKNKRIIPIIMALGNHDAGFNGLANVKLSIDQSGPWFFAYNPQHLDNGMYKVPKASNRKGHFYHIIGSNVLITLDSGYIQSYESQAVYLQATARKFSLLQYSLIGFYHVPLYPSCFHELATHGQSSEALRLSRELYQPLFNQYKFRICFQNHVHKFKRTFPINGTVYIGDGNLGVDSVGCPKQYQMNQTVMAKTLFEGSRHYWSAKIVDKHMSLQAFDIDGSNIDNTEIDL